MMVHLKPIVCWNCSSPQISKNSEGLWLTNHVCQEKVGKNGIFNNLHNFNWDKMLQWIISVLHGKFSLWWTFVYICTETFSLMEICVYDTETFALVDIRVYLAQKLSLWWTFMYIWHRNILQTCWNKKSSTLGLISLSERNRFNYSHLKFILFVLKTDKHLFCIA
jgi:hypothetical protein